MEYNKIDFSDIDTSPKDKKQLEENIERKIKRLEKSNSEEHKHISLDLTQALQWLRKSNVDLPIIDGEEYYRLGYYISNNNIVFNVQIWQHYFEDVDVLKRIYMSSCEDDLDNDENTIIVAK